MRVLVTGAGGFVGRWLVPRLLDRGDVVTAAVAPGGAAPEGCASVPLELTDDASVRAATARGFDAVVHLAAVASGTDARRDPGLAWDVNAAGTARLADASVQGRQGEPPVFLLASSAEVYGAARDVTAPRRETDPVAPCSPYAASKLGAEIAAQEVWRRTGLRVVIARAFPHTGRGQDTRFVVPAFAARLRAAKRAGAKTIAVGNLAPVRDFLHVADVVDAYVRLLGAGQAGEVYNVASGRGTSIGEIFAKLRALIRCDAAPEADPALMRPADIASLVGDAEKLRAATGWCPRISLDDTLAEVASAETN